MASIGRHVGTNGPYDVMVKPGQPGSASSGASHETAQRSGRPSSCEISSEPRWSHTCFP
jgi:hypothetical protein